MDLSNLEQNARNAYGAICSMLNSEDRENHSYVNDSGGPPIFDNIYQAFIEYGDSADHIKNVIQDDESKTIFIKAAFSKSIKTNLIHRLHGKHCSIPYALVQSQLQ